jgi:tetratricopeptide (TPR) repeat protein
MSLEFSKKLIELKKTLDPNVDIVTMKYILGRDANGIPNMTSTRERLMKRSKNYAWTDPIHECIPLIGNIHYSDIEIWHLPEPDEKISTRNLDIYENLNKSGKQLSPRQLYYYARELKDHGKWSKAAIFFEKFLATGKGWVEDNVAACLALATCYKLSEEHDLVLPSLIRAFNYDSPRAEVCSEIGYYYKNLGDYGLAFKWFETAANLNMEAPIGIISNDYYGYIPNIEACVCLSYLGDQERANIFNEKAAKFKPNDASVLQNREFFKTVLEKK